MVQAVSWSRRRAGYLEGLVSIVVNIILFFLKYFCGVVFNSIAVISDAFHTLSDSLTSVVVVLGSWISSKPADRRHPFGHGRAESIATIVIGSMLVMVGVDLIQRSYEKLVSKEPLVFGWVLVVVLALSACAKALLALWAMVLGRKYGSKSIAADAWHHASDAIATALLAIAIPLGGNIWWLDSVLGFAVSALIVYTGVEIVLEQTHELLGRAPTLDELKILRDAVAGASPQVRDLHHVHIHSYGDHTEVTLHIRLPPSTSVFDAHRIASDIEQRIRDSLRWEATVHIEPYITERDNTKKDREKESIEQP
uniref:Cation transporter n=1 Tax=Ignisphaera aggregans TaxID=334771 RepID=A0A7C2Z9K9_9CREN